MYSRYGKGTVLLLGKEPTNIHPVVIECKIPDDESVEGGIVRQGCSVSLAKGVDMVKDRVGEATRWPGTKSAAGKPSDQSPSSSADLGHQVSFGENSWTRSESRMEK